MCVSRPACLEECFGDNALTKIRERASGLDATAERTCDLSLSDHTSEHLQVTDTHLENDHESLAGDTSDQQFGLVIRDSRRSSTPYQQT